MAEPGGTKNIVVWVGMTAFFIILGFQTVRMLDDPPSPTVLVTYFVGLAVFLALFVPLAFRRRPGTLSGPAPWLQVAVMFVLAVLLSALNDRTNMLLFVAGAVAAAYLPMVPAIAGVFAAAIAVGVVAAAQGFPSSQVITFPMQMLAIGMLGYGYARLSEANTALENARSEVARLAVADERLRFARDLHDLLGHTLSVIRVKSELAARLVGRDPQRAEAEIIEVEKVARDALQEVRGAVTGYREASLGTELQSITALLTELHITTTIHADELSLPDPVDEAMAMVVREAVTNVVRHSHASKCDIVVASSADAAHLEVADDGIGADPSAARAGLRGIRERIAAVGGEVSVETAPGAGFRLCVSAPMAPR